MAVDSLRSVLVIRDPDSVSGEAVFAGTRVPVATLITWLQDGYSIDQYIEDNPSVHREQVFAALEVLRETLLAPVTVEPRLPTVDTLRSVLVNRDPGRVSGAAVFIGTRVPAEILVDWLQGGETIEYFLENYPSVRREQVTAALEILRLTLLQRCGCCSTRICPINSDMRSLSTSWRRCSMPVGQGRRAAPCSAWPPRLGSALSSPVIAVSSTSRTSLRPASRSSFSPSGTSNSRRSSHSYRIRVKAWGKVPSCRPAVGTGGPPCGVIWSNNVHRVCGHLRRIISRLGRNLDAGRAIADLGAREFGAADTAPAQQTFECG